MTGSTPMGDEHYRKPDTVEFTISETKTYVVGGDVLLSEKENGDGHITGISLYAEGEHVTEYLAGDTIYDKDDLAVIRAATNAANLYFDDEDPVVLWKD